jgi:hypothetical protein
MPEPYTTQRMLSLRKLTRAAADQMRHQLKDILSAVGPLLQPKAALGDYVRGVKEPVRGADALFKEIEGMFQKVASEKPFGVRRELTAPLDFSGSSVDVNPLEYSHTAAVKGHSKKVTVTSPFRWVMSYNGYSLPQLKVLLGAVSPSNDQLYAFVLHYVTLRSQVVRPSPITNVFKMLRYKLNVTTQPEFGELPLTCISAPIFTVRPPDEVIIETTEMTGSDNFEEVIDLEALATLGDPMKESLVELARAHGEQI